MFTKEELQLIANVLAQTQVQVMQAQKLLVIIGKCQQALSNTAAMVEPMDKTSTTEK